MANTKIPVELSSTPSIVDNGNATAITIDSSENVGIGNTNPSAFDLLSGATADNLVIGDGTQIANLWLHTATTGGTTGYGHVAFADSNTSSSTDQYAGLIQYYHGDNTMSFYTGSTKRLRIDSDGLKFGSDTAAANALDDYEEGDWTPLFVGTTGSAGLHAQVYSAKYTKVGRLVSFYVTIALTNKGDYTGLTRLQGLPFTNAGSTTQVALGSFPDTGYGTSSGNIVIAAAVESSQSYISFYEGSRLDVRHSFSDVGTGYYCNVGGTYMTSS